MKYRIFSLIAKYERDGKRDVAHFQDRMVRDEDDVDALKVDWEQTMRESISNKDKSPAIDILIKITEHPKRRSWALGWFNHYTLRCDDLPDKAAVLASFEEYVREVEREFNQETMASPLPEGYICLMGANDRWRWRGESHDHKAPCECEHCVKQGIWRIDH